MALDINKIKADLAEQERLRAAQQERLLDEARKANLEKLAADEVKKRIARIKDLEKAKSGLKRQIFDLTQGGKISDEKKLQEAIDGYNKSDDLQSTLSNEATEISQGKYRISNNKVVPLSSIKKSEAPFPTTEPKGAGAQVEEVVTKRERKKKPVVTEEVEVTTPPKKPAKKPGVFDPAAARRGEEASMGAVTPAMMEEAVGELPIERIYELVKTKYKNIDSIFLYNDELGRLLREAVGDIDDENDDMTADEFERRLAQTDWALSGAETWRNRSAEKRQYSDLLGKYENQLRLAATETERGKIQEKIDSLKKNSEYGRGLASAKAAILRTASGLIGTPSPEVLDALASEIYDAGIEDDANQIRDKVLSRFSYKAGNIIGGTAGTNLNDLRKTAAANGIELDEIYGDKVQDWLKRVAQGESIETFKSLIRDRAALGLPDKVANLLRQGLDLEDVYDPYRKIMASVLELQPDSIKLSDPTLTSAFGPNGELPLFEFKRMLRKDPRWQYTDNAREDVSTAALQVLRDFGFQG
jgi:hypothetical protein